MLMACGGFVVMVRQCLRSGGSSRYQEAVAGGASEDHCNELSL